MILHAMSPRTTQHIGLVCIMKGMGKHTAFKELKNRKVVTIKNVLTAACQADCVLHRLKIRENMRLSEQLTASESDEQKSK